MNSEIHCPLCAAESVSPYTRDRRRAYFSCGLCRLVFVPAEYHLARDAERAEYELHRNDPTDQGYRTFLARLAAPLMDRLGPGSQGLDFGCGPGPALAQMLREAGHSVALYDSFFVPDRKTLEGLYDFICATEVVEHLRQPGLQLEHLWSRLRDGGWLGVMTKLVRDREAFEKWHYKNDPTHVCFFSAQTWHWWANRYGAELEIVGADVILMQRRN